MKAILETIAAVLPFVVGFSGVALLAYASLVVIPRAVRSPQWPHVVGHIHTREVKEDLDGVRIRFGYSYRVHGVSYIGRRVFFGDDMSRYGSKGTTELYPQSCAVKVYYHPMRPNVSVLEPGWHNEILGQFLLGLILMVLGWAPAVGVLPPNKPMQRPRTLSRRLQRAHT